MSAPVLLVPMAPTQTSAVASSSPKARRAPLQALAPLEAPRLVKPPRRTGSGSGSCSTGSTPLNASSALTQPSPSLAASTSGALPFAGAASLAAALPPPPPVSAAVEEALKALPAHHVALAISRRVSTGALMLEENLQPALEAPRKKRGSGKSVRWRDDLGERLSQTLSFHEEHPPAAVSSADPHLAQLDALAAADSNTSPAFLPRRVSADFDTSVLPQNSASLLQSVTRRGVQLEALCLRAPLVFLTIRVLNLGFQKDVFVRMTTNNWASYTDIPASYLPGTADPSTDRFYATLNIPPSSSGCAGVQFCVCFRCVGKDFWDNNDGKNYLIALTVHNPHLRFGGMARHQSFA